MLLADSRIVDVGNLSRIFFNVTNSYKFLFFQALLDEIKSIDLRSTVSEKNVDLSLLILHMLEMARPLLEEYRISFGVQDKISVILARLNSKQGGADEMERLKRYVPFRLLTPFFADELRGKNDQQKNALILKRSQEAFFSERPPLYRLDLKNDILVLHPVWIEYIRDNFPIVKAWFQYQWLSYLQDRNLTLPNLKDKIDPDESRRAIPKVYKEFWNGFLQQRDVRCIYTGSILSPGNYALDHYIPYSYVAHNELWNLVPASKMANSSKSDSLASDDSVGRFLDLQYLGICSNKRFFEQEKFSKIAESYLSGLKIPKVQILDKSVFRKRLQDVIVSLRDCAKLNGFPDGWSYHQAKTGF